MRAASFSESSPAVYNSSTAREPAGYPPTIPKKSAGTASAGSRNSRPSQRQWRPSRATAPHRTRNVVRNRNGNKDGTSVERHVAMPAAAPAALCCGNSRSPAAHSPPKRIGPRCFMQIPPAFMHMRKGT